MKLVSVNIEGRNHLDRVQAFLRHEQPDVVCMQELCRQDIAAFESLLEMRAHYAPMSTESCWDDEIGVAVFAREAGDVSITHFAGATKASQSVNPDERFEAKYHAMKYQLIVADVWVNGMSYRIGTTHLPVTKEGQPTWFQYEAIDRLLELIAAEEEIVFCGDTNAPRGGDAFAKLTEHYADNVPRTYTTSIDGDLHRAGQLPYMVDGLFSSPAYQASDVRLERGVSDHYAIVATVEKI